MVVTASERATTLLVGEEESVPLKLIPGEVVVVLVNPDSGPRRFQDGLLVPGAGARILTVLTADSLGEATQTLFGGPESPWAFHVQGVVQGRYDWSATNTVELIMGTP